MKKTKFTIKRIDLNFLVEWLRVPLHGEEIRTRNKFFQAIKSEYDQVMPGRTEILTKYAKVDEAGKPIIKEGKYELQEDKKQQCYDEVKEYLDTSVALNIDSKQVKAVLGILKNMKIGLDIEQGEVYDRVMTDLEEFVK